MIDLPAILARCAERESHAEWWTCRADVLAAHEDVRALVAEAERLRADVAAECRRHNRTMDRHRAETERLGRENRDLRVEVERLGAKVEAAFREGLRVGRCGEALGFPAGDDYDWQTSAARAALEGK